jgi:membrane-bound serine protease (ClpP class)
VCLWVCALAFLGGNSRGATEGRTLVIDVSGEIDLGLAPYLERVLAEATPEDVVLLQINTFGGRIDAAVQIRDALLAAKAKTIAFVHPRAISAGALLSLATDTIVMSRAATMGAATPIEMQGGKMQPVEAKVVSYFRKEMKSTAEAKGRRGDIAEAMVDASVEIPGLDGKNTTLTLTTAEALRYGVAAYQAESVQEICERMGRPAASVIHARPTWAEQLARFLSSTVISSLLITLGMLGIGIELWAPGHLVAGIVGICCLLLFFFGHHVVHLAGWEEMILFGVGVALVLLEIAFWPGHGSLVVLGILLILGSLIKAMLNLKHVPLDVSWSLGWVPQALARVFGSLLAAGAGMVLASRFLPRTALGRPLILREVIDGRATAVDPIAEPLVGRRGVTATALRPTGKAIIGDQRIDVVSDGGFVETGVPIQVVRLDGARVVVRKATQ